MNVTSVLVVPASPSSGLFDTLQGIEQAAFNLLFAFDEVISLGYKENVTVMQVKQVGGNTVITPSCSHKC